MLPTGWATAGIVGDLSGLAGGWLFYRDSLGILLGNGTLLGGLDFLNNFGFRRSLQ